MSLVALNVSMRMTYLCWVGAHSFLLLALLIRIRFLFDPVLLSALPPVVSQLGSSLSACMFEVVPAFDVVVIVVVVFQYTAITFEAIHLRLVFGSELRDGRRRRTRSNGRG